MPTWYYKSGEREVGPVDASELRKLAAAGSLKPDDFVRRDDMKSWTQANKIKGLFAGEISSQPAAPRLVAPSTSLSPPASVEATPQPTIAKNAVATSAAKKPGSFLVKLGLGLVGCGCLSVVLLVVLLAVATSFVMSRRDDVPFASNRPSATEYVSPDGNNGYCLTLDDRPRPIVQALSEGKEVWELRGYQLLDEPGTLFIVFSQSHDLEHLVSLGKIDKLIAKRVYEKLPPNGEVYGWSVWPPSKTINKPGSSLSDDHTWTFERQGTEWTLERFHRMSNSDKSSVGFVSTTRDSTRISVPENRNQGTWAMQRTENMEHTGRAEHLPSANKATSQNGSVIKLSAASGRKSSQANRQSDAVATGNEGPKSDTEAKTDEWGRVITATPGIFVQDTPPPPPEIPRSDFGKSSAKSAQARKKLMDVAGQMEGPFARVVEDIVSAVENGIQPWSVADSRMNDIRPGQHRFSRETIAAYQVWRAARIAEGTK